MMKKISNSVKITVPSNNRNTKDRKDRKEQVKASLNQIQKLSQEIDEQISKNNRYSKQRNQQLSQISPEVQKTYEDNEQQDSNYWPDRRQANSQPTTIQKAIQKSLNQYLNSESMKLVNSSHEEILNQQQSHMIDIENYEEYKRIKEFNKDFRQIVGKLQGLRRKASSVHRCTKIQNDSDILSMMYQIVKSQNNHQSPSFGSSLQAIEKLEQIQDSLQTRLQSLNDSLQYKQKIIGELKTNKKSLSQDIEFLQNRNQKLKKQIASIEEVKEFVNSSSEDDQELQEQRKASEHYQDCQQNVQFYQIQNDPQHYQQEYLDLMKFYQLYNPQKQQIDQPFPKNKTEAMMLLNRIETKIQQLQMQKTLNSCQN